MMLKTKKNKLRLLGLCILLLLPFTGCGTDENEGSAAKSRPITVISREEGSGTRSAFVELFGIQDEESTDLTTPYSEITNNTAVMMASVSGDKNAIGYISLGSVNDTVKTVRIDGVEANAETVKDGRYRISRPFILATKEETSAAAQDFIRFILSRDGQDVIEAGGWVRTVDSGSYAGGGQSGKVVAAGSSSVAPVMEALREAYLLAQDGVEVEIQQSDSSTGINAVADGICDIGMSSRTLKASENEKRLRGHIISIDGITIIVNNANEVTDLTADQVKSIFTGAAADWTAL
ncbi:MAG: substrate-binding domain-containing protein [Clostridiales Family XIII bacterium]|nr:substrate-binding domain-containing protein [Clostridiales Family XIII bacterium]